VNSFDIINSKVPQIDNSCSWVEPSDFIFFIRLPALMSTNLVLRLLFLFDTSITL
jgi:hypothetical protein